MRSPTLGLVVLTALALAGCSQSVNVTELATNLRDRVSSDAAMAEARRIMRPSPLESGGGGGGRPRPKPAAPGQVDANAKADATTPGTPGYQPTPAPPPVVYYYPAPTAAPSP